MKNLSKLFAITSVLFLGVYAISPLKDRFQEWRGYQAAYNEYVAAQPVKLKPTQPGLKQIWNPDLGRIDRCVTCHSGLKEPALARAPQPFRTHSTIYHDFEDYGCTICHGGQGLATKYRDAVGKTEFWDEPVIPTRYLEASCGKCHAETSVPQAPTLNRGRELLVQQNCAGCHKIGDVPKGWAPNLDGIGSKVSRAWLIRWLKNPKAYLPNARMPQFPLSDEEAALLADFLMSFKVERTVEAAVAASLSPDEQEKRSTEGRGLFGLARCISCHAVNGKGGTRAPDLGRIGNKANQAYLFSYIKDPKALQPGVEMSRYRFTDKELTAVTAYMMEEFTDPEFEEGNVGLPLTDPGFFEKGKRLFKKHNCGGCHTLKGLDVGEEFGPELTFVGSKKRYEIDFSQVKIEHTLAEYLFTKLKQPRIFSTTMKMPDYGLSDEDATALTTALLSLVNEPIPPKYRVPAEPKSVYNPQGEFGKLVNDLSCFSCHTIYGRGYRLATDLSREGSQVNPAWLAAYFKVPYSLRPILTERMPTFFLSDREIKTLTDYLNMALLDDGLEAPPIALNDPTRIAEGRLLYFDKYGCQACHIIGSSGGYVGPALTDEGRRARPGWVYRWLKDPQRYIPDTIEPKTGMTDEEAEAITAYLMSLKQK